MLKMLNIKIVNKKEKLRGMLLPKDIMKVNG